MATTIAEVRSLLHSWINQVLNAEGGENIPIIFSHQSAPAPREPYIVIDDSPTRLRQGREMATMADEEGNQDLYDEYEDTWSLDEVGGHGDRLRKLIESQGRQDIRDLFAAANVAYRGQASGIVPVMERIMSVWKCRHVVDLRFGIVSKTRYQPGIIEEVAFSGTVEEV